MFAGDQYRLLDFGEGRKLEQFGRHVLDRPAPAAAQMVKEDPHRWTLADSRFVGHRRPDAGCGEPGSWEPRLARGLSWSIGHPPVIFELRATEFGHVGVFPEQAENWDWIVERVTEIKNAGRVNSRPRVLNLFAYTGGSTLTAAAAGADLVHVDAAKSTVAWARRNGELSGLSAAPIRWICDDAARFVARELKRGNRYQGIVLDPPTYGHGAEGEPWRIERDLSPLLANCSRLLANGPAFVLLTCHAPQLGPAELTEDLKLSIDGAADGQIEAGDLWLKAADGRRLHSGVVARWHRNKH